LYVFAPILISDRSALHGDNLTFFVPRAFRYSQMIQSGVWTFWQHGDAFGHPRYAESSHGWFHPVNYLLFQSLPWLRAHDLLLVANYSILAVSTYSLARALDLDRWFAVLAALLATFSPGALGLTGNATWLESVAWSAAVLALYEATYARRTMRSILPLALGIALLLLAGYPPTAFATILFLGLVSGLRILVDEHWSVARGIALVAAVAIGFALAAIQLLPLAELLQQSPRQAAVKVTAWLPRVASLRGLFLSNDVSLYERVRDVGPGLGSVMGLLGLMGLPLLRDRRGLTYVVAIPVFLELAVGPTSTVFALGRAFVPGLGRFRLTYQFFWVTLVPTAVVVAMVLRDVARRIYVKRIWLASGAFAIAVLLFAWKATAVATATPYYRSAWLGLFGAAVVCVGIAARSKPAAWLGPVLCLIVSLDVLTTKAGLLRFFDSGLLDTGRETAEFLHRAQQSDPTALTAHYQTDSYERRLMTLLFAPPSIPDYEQMIPFCRRNICASLNLLDGLNLVDAHESLPLVRQSAVLDLIQTEIRGEGTLPVGERFIDRFRVRFVISPDSRKPDPIAGDLRAVFEHPAHSPRVFENSQIRAPHEWTRDIEWVSDRKQAIRRLAEQPARLVVESQPIREFPLALRRFIEALPWAVADPGLRFETDRPQPGYVFIPIPPYPGWRARLDGQRTGLLPAHVLGQVVAVPAGAHVIELDFMPYAFHLGVLVTLASALGASAAFGLHLRGRRGSRPQRAR
jgi:hypothetical protein